MSKSDSNADETVQVTMTRREYTALASSGVVLSHATNDDGGWLDGLLGGNDDDGPGLFEDMEIRHEDSHVITDPDTIDFIGEALDVEMPNAYDNGVRIKVQGDVAVEGEDIEPSSVTTPTVVTERATIGSRERAADLIVRAVTDDSSTLEIIDGQDNEQLAEFGTGQLSSNLQSILDNWSHPHGDDRLHLHYGTGNFVHHGGLTFDNSSLLVTGEGRNATKIIAGDNLSAGADVFEIQGTGKIFTFKDFKMIGKRGSGVDASGIHFTGGAEFIFHGVEVRSFARKNIWFDTTSGGWNGMYDTWSLDPGDVGVYIDGGSSSAFQEIAIEGCKLKNGGGGTHALYAHEVRDINIVGGHITGADAVNFDRVLRGRISDVQFKDLSGTYAIALGNGVAGDLAERIIITDNYFTDGPTNGIKLNATADRNKIVDNRFWAVSGESSMTPVTGVGNDGHLVIRDNTPTVEVDVRNIYAFNGAKAHHDGSGTNTAGPAFYNGTDWVSLVDGTTIA